VRADAMSGIIANALIWMWTTPGNCSISTSAIVVGMKKQLQFGGECVVTTTLVFILAKDWRTVVVELLVSQTTLLASIVVTNIEWRFWNLFEITKLVKAIYHPQEGN
jgi:hypothetical protein